MGGKHRTPEERLSYAQKLEDRFAKAMQKHGKRFYRFSGKGEHESAIKEKDRFDQAERLHKKWQREAGLIAQKILARDTLRQRAPESGRGEVPVLTPAEQQRLEREERDHQNRVEKKRRMLSAASISSDPRTAVGSRSYDIVNMGANMRATINHFNNCIRRQADRTDTRRLAWETFDYHYEDVCSNLFGEPKFEPGVDTSSIPGLAEARLHALAADATLRADLGAFSHSLLVEVVYKHHALADLPGLAHYLPRERVVLLLHALDMAAIYWGLDQEKRTRGYKFATAINSLLDAPPTD